MKTKLYIFFSLILFSYSLIGQELKENDIREATNYFEEGRYNDVINVFKSREFKQADKQIKAEAYKLLSAAYYEIDELEKADTALVSFLELRPLYKINNTTDPEAFIRGLHRFKISPKLNFYFMVGANKTSAYVVQKNILSENVNYDLPYKGELGFQLNMGIEKLLFYNLYLYSGLNFENMRYARTLEYIDRPATVNFVLEDQMVRFELPIGLFYKLYLGNFSVGAGAGVSALYNRSILSAKYTSLTTTKVFDELYATNNRLNYNGRLNFNGRVAYQVGGIEYFANFSYKNDVLSPVNSYYKRELYYPMLYVDDKFFLINSQLSFGISIRLNYKVVNRYE